METSKSTDEELVKKPEATELELRKSFDRDTDTLQQQTINLMSTAAPYLTVNETDMKQWLDPYSEQTLESMRFFKLCSCTTEQVDDLAAYFQERMEKLFTALYPFQSTFAYGVVSHAGQIDLVIGIDSPESQKVTDSVIKGLLTGIELVPWASSFMAQADTTSVGGVIGAVPVAKLENEPQRFNISSLMRSLNGLDYTVLCVATPYSLAQIQQKYRSLIDIRDACFAVSKRSLANQRSEAETHSTTETHTDSTSTTTSNSFNINLMGSFIGEGFMGGLSFGGSHSKSKTYAHSDSISKSIAQALGTSETISYDVQNGFALEIIKYCDKAIERLQQGLSTGLWGSAIVYSAGQDLTANIIQACLYGELAKPADNILPPQILPYITDKSTTLQLPRMEPENPLLAPVTSPELGMLCTPPYEAVPGFELKQGKVYPMIAGPKDGICIGKVSDGYRPLENMSFTLREADLNKHTFICGITGSGKTTTVKRILTSCSKPFLVIESAKKEYRSLRLPTGAPTVYTLGKPELNCLQFNPFYIQCGINLQTHIDFLKDLFNASFSFYGPMPYILERCLHNIYQKKGWNLTLGYHPFLINQQKSFSVFDADYLKKQYALKAHKYLFPTMQDLKDEVKRYIDVELKYDGEVRGNIKTAMLARLDSLCVGSKGFMLNTHTPIDIHSLMQDQVVFELEGLADDADKAFCVGLFVIFINEYRQVYKNDHLNDKLDLQHLLVIEEAHRLLKNVDTDRSTENIGNPKGKAVEHFTNMIAEMRSYGQGVIIAEQIPSKLAPDVIKNSSNKIVQRIVSYDDQALVANTIGIKEPDAVYLGGLKTGYALCHKEGMALPVFVKIDPVEESIVPDENLFTKRDGKMFEDINLSLVKESSADILDDLGLKLLNSLLAQTPELVLKTLCYCKKALKDSLVIKNTALVFCANEKAMYGMVLASSILPFLVHGVYGLPALPRDDFYEALIDFLGREDLDSIAFVRKKIEKAYMQNPRNRCITIISELIKQNYDKTVDVKKSVEQYFVFAEEALVNDIADAVQKGGKYDF